MCHPAFSVQFHPDAAPSPRCYLSMSFRYIDSFQRQGGSAHMPKRQDIHKILIGSVNHHSRR